MNLAAGHDRQRLVDQRARVLGDGRERVVVHLAPGDDRHALVEERDERAQDARLRLAAEAEEDEVVPRQDRVHDLRHHSVLVPQHAREQRAAGAEAGEKILAHLVFDGAPGAFGHSIRRLLEGAESLR